MHIAEEQIDNITILKISGKIDAVSADNLGAYVTTKIEHGHIYLILDCESVDFLSSSGMRIFLLSLKAVEKVHGILYFSSFRIRIKEILELAGTSKYFPTFTSIEEAKKELKKSLQDIL